jgi:photosystem II stability/assembly factor-like uncharacterized protein
MRTVLVWLLVWLWAAIASPAHALTVDEIVARHIAALGGADKIAALHSLRTSGKAVFGSGDYKVEAEWASLAEQPGRIRVEITIQGLTGVEAYDGKEAWSVEPWEGRREPKRTPADVAKALAHRADIPDPLVGWREKGHRVEYLGTEDVDGTSAHKLRVVLKDGDVQYVYLDPDAFLVIRVLEEQHVRGVERWSETDYGSYASVAGVWLPFSIESGERDKPRRARYLIERAEANVATLGVAGFSFPVSASAVKRLFPPAANIASTPSASAPPPPPSVARTQGLDAGVLSGLGARNIGSAAMSGRVAAVTAHHEDGKTTVYVGAASGGVWKSTDGGTTFKPIFDRMPVQSIGAIAIDPSHAKTVWVGTGEAWTRNSASIGDGIYKSLDGGATWASMGLQHSERIARILVHPKDGNVVYACVPGALWSDSSERGLYKTTDGGKNWTQVLKGRNLSTGCSSLAMDPKDPERLYAGMWDFRRKGWTFRSGGDGPSTPSMSGLHRSTDGGRTWIELDAKMNLGLPQGPWGRVEVAIAPSDPKIVYAFIESKDSALYRSTDGGATWEARDKSQGMVWRPFYFGRLVIDPTNPNRLFKPGFTLSVSEDGGRSFAMAAGAVGSGGGAHGDWHDLWIDPDNPKHVIGGDDGGLWIAYDGGSHWWKVNALPISQFYHVSVDAKDPYQVYGGLQDNSTWVGDSAYPGGITNSRWENLYGGDGFWAHLDPTDPDWVYVEYQGGHIARVNRLTLASRDIQPKAGYHEKLRFNWNAPIAVSPTQKGTLYLGSQFLFRSRDRGDTWERISPDLSTNDKDKQQQEQSGGITVDNSAAEMHTTIYSIAESPKDPRLIWVGTDDGNLQLTRDGGKRWTNVAGNVTGLPKGSWVSWVEASRFAANVAYAAFDRHTFGDMTPWVYRTADFGRTWTRIAAPDQGVRGYAHVLKEDTQKPSVLFLGTEFGLWISVDAGGHWAEFKGGNFPAVAVRDLAVHPREHDLVLATHGRGIWIIDDITPLRVLSDELLGKSAAFLPGRPVQQRMPANGGWVQGDATFVGENPAPGAVITYYQRARHLFGPISLEVLDASGKLVDSLTPSKRRGINRVPWSMQVKPPHVPKAVQLATGAAQGPRVVPGTYTVRLTKGTEVISSKILIGLDRRAPYKATDRKAQFDAVMKAHALFGDMSELTDTIDGAVEAAAKRKEAVGADPVGKRLTSVLDRLMELKRQIVATKEGGAVTGEERIREHLDILYGALMQWEGRPAKYQLERILALKRELGDARTQFKTLASGDIALVNDALKEKKLDPIPVVAPAHAERESDEAPTTAALRCVATRGRVCEEDSALGLDRR